MPIQTIYVGQFSIAETIPGYERFSNIVLYNNLFAHNGHRFRTFKCTKSLDICVSINDESKKILGNLWEFRLTFHCKVIFQGYLFISHAVWLQWKHDLFEKVICFVYIFLKIRLTTSSVDAQLIFPDNKWLSIMLTKLPSYNTFVSV